MKQQSNAAGSRRIKKQLRRAFRLSVATAAVISIFKLCVYAEEQRRDLLRRERRHSAAITLLFSISALVALFTALASAIAEVKKRNGGYAIDLFDRDEYDIVSPDEEDELESIMHGELDGKNDESASHGHSVGEHIPVDDEATVENF
ncbi:MAG: hypothetical protein PUA74_07445 [Clostridiales bacterium]|nr:hypothetical protein [Clostridiales bacterium]